MAKKKKTKAEEIQEKERKKQAKFEAKQQKLKSKRKKKRIAKEEKKINNVINFPFKLLTQVSLLISCLVFIILYFGSDKAVHESVLISFLTFTMIYLGGGIIMVTIFYIISEDRIKVKEQLEKEEEEKRIEEMKKKEEEYAKLEQVIQERKRKTQSESDFDDSADVMDSSIDEGLADAGLPDFDDEDKTPIPDSEFLNNFVQEELETDTEGMELEKAPEIPELPEIPEIPDMPMEPMAPQAPAPPKEDEFDIPAPPA